MSNVVLKSALALFVMSLSLSIRVTAVPVVTWDGGGSDNNWATPENWGDQPYGDPPYPDDTVPAGVRVDGIFSQTVVVDSPVPSVNDVYLGRFTGNTGTINIQPGGELTFTYLQMSHGNATAASPATGIINQTGGSMTVNGSIGMASGDGNKVAAYNLSAGSLFVAASVTVGGSSGNDAGTDSVLNIDGGEASIAVDLNLQGDAAVVGDEGVLDLSGGELTVGQLLRNNQPGETEGKINFSGGTLNVGSLKYNNPDGVGAGFELTVGASSTLNLGGFSTHEITDGLTIASGGTLGAGVDETTTATIETGLLTVEDGANLDFSINGLLEESDTWVTNGGLALSDNMTINLIVDVLAGDVKQTVGPWTIFDYSSVGSITGLTDFNTITWNISTTEGTNLKSEGVVSDTGSLIVLSAFEAFAIPEPSTGMLLGVGTFVALMRRRVRRR